MILFLKKFKLKKINILYKNIILIFIFSSFIFGLYMVFFENLSMIDTIYFLFITATTIGYGDISPSTEIGKLLIIPYAILSLSSLGSMFGIISNYLEDITLKNKKGEGQMKEEVDVLIAHYPSEDKVKSILEQLNEEKKEMNIVLLNNKLKELPVFTKEYKYLNITFIKGLSSDRVALNKANITKTKSAIILSSDPLKIDSDDYNSSAVSMIEFMNKDVYTIVEKVRLDDILFKLTKADVIIPVSSAGVITQEVLDHGAVELSNAIFDNSMPGTQYNITYSGKETTWEKIAINLISKGCIPEGFKENNLKFNVLPKVNDKIKNGTIIKYRAEKRIDYI